MVYPAAVLPLVGKHPVQAGFHGVRFFRAGMGGGRQGRGDKGIQDQEKDWEALYPGFELRVVK